MRGPLAKPRLIAKLNRDIDWPIPRFLPGSTIIAVAAGRAIAEATPKTTLTRNRVRKVWAKGRRKKAKETSEAPIKTSFFRDFLSHNLPK